MYSFLFLSLCPCRILYDQDIYLKIFPLRLLISLSFGVGVGLPIGNPFYGLYSVVIKLIDLLRQNNMSQTDVAPISYIKVDLDKLYKSYIKAILKWIWMGLDWVGYLWC